MNNKVQKISASILLGTMLLYSLPVAAFTKDETVYSNANSDGERYKSIVSTHLENSEEEKILRDLTDLLNIENTSGDEEFTREGDTLIWKADSNDIYYKGESDKELPVDISIKYELDGEEISADEIAGKSGEVKITIEFINNEEHDVWMNGKYEKMYTPFVVAVGTYINNENNTKIEVKNGKTIDDGSKTFIVGLAFPGLEESLDISYLIEIPNSLEITMKTDSFEMNNIISYITPIKADDMDLDIFNDLNKIYSKVDKLQSASQQIEEGAKTLAEGAQTYYEKSQEFNQAVGKFSDGMSYANSSYSKLDTGINSIDSGAKQLQSGSKQLSDGTSALNTGVSQMKSKVSASAGELPKLVDGASQVSEGLDKLYDGITDAASNENAEVTEKLTAIVTEEKTQAGTLLAYNQSLSNVKSQLAAIDTTDLDEDTIIAIQTAIGTIDAQMAANTTIAGTLNNNADKYVGLVTGIGDSTTQQLQGLANNVALLKDGAKQVSDGTKTLQLSMSTLTGGLETLSSSTKQLSDGASTLYNSTFQLTTGTSQAKEGSSQMKEGLQTLDSSAKQILLADTQLTEGAKTIQDGAKELSAGVQEFNESGINKICGYINNDIRNIGDRAEALKELSEKYNTFTKVDTDTEGKVKFITIVDSIKRTDKDNGQEEIDEKPSK